MCPREGSIPELGVGMVLGQAQRQIRYLLLKLSLATHSIIDISECHPEPGHYCRLPCLSLVKRVASCPLIGPICHHKSLSCQRTRRIRRRKERFMAWIWNFEVCIELVFSTCPQPLKAKTAVLSIHHFLLSAVTYRILQVQ